jgi:TonB family protein
VRWDSPAVLVSAATLAVHLIVVVVIDAIVVTHPYVPEPPAPHIETFDVDVEPPPPPKAPEPEPDPEPEPEEPQEPAKPAPTPTVRAPRASTSTKAPPTETPVQPSQPTTPGGSGKAYQMADLPTGPGYAPGKKKVIKPGTGGRGTGTGTGTGAGSGSDPPPAPPGPVSVSMLKKRALPKNDAETYTNEYPAEAKQLGIEGQIMVRLTVSSEGKVKKAVLLKKLGHGLDEWALARAKKIEFTPALDTNDQPVESTVVWTFDMTLPK